MGPTREITTEDLGQRVAALPGFAAVQAAVRRSGLDVRVVGGAVRDALLGLQTDNLDLVVDGDPAALIQALGAGATVYDRFETATVELPSGPVDVARARAETYAAPGALPDVSPAGFDEDLRRRDFSVNAIAVAVADPGTLIDPLEGLGDLRDGVLRILHERSFADDPTRALRGARYAARLGLEPDPKTLAALARTDLRTVSGDRVAAEIRRLALEPSPRRGFELLGKWGVIELQPGTGELIERAAGLVDAPPWAEIATRPAVVATAVRGPRPAVRELAAARPGSPSAAVAAADGHGGVDLVLARALGAEWLDEWAERWRLVQLEISGDDLIGAGVEQGPAVGRGLAAALRAKLDGEIEGSEAELRVALDAAGRG